MALEEHMCCLRYAGIRGFSRQSRCSTARVGRVDGRMRAHVVRAACFVHGHAEETSAREEPRTCGVGVCHEVSPYAWWLSLVACMSFSP